MKKSALIFCLLLALGGMLWAQQGSESKPYPAVHNTPSSRQGPSAFSQSTVQGCLMGSEATSAYVLTDEHTGEIYLLHGNDWLLKQQVGKEVVISGVAYPLRPSNKKGELGYINPSAGDRTAGSDVAGQKVRNFTTTDIEAVANRCTQQTQAQKAAIAASQATLGSVTSDNPNATEPHIGFSAQSQSQSALVGCVSGSSSDLLLAQPKLSRNYRLRGNVAALKNELGRMVKVTGYVVPGSGPSVSGAKQPAPIFQVSGMQELQPYCSYLAPPGQPPIAVGGKSGNVGEASLETDTSTAGETTPGYQTQPWKARASGEQASLDAGGVPQPHNNTATQGVPPNPELTAQDPGAAERIAASAERAEVNNSQYQLGVNTQPNYSESAEQQTQRANEEGIGVGIRQDGNLGVNNASNSGQNAQQALQGSVQQPSEAGTKTFPQNQNSVNNTRLPGSSQRIHAPQQGQRQKEEQAARAHEPVPTLIGCLVASSKSSHEFYLIEQKTGKRIRLEGAREEFKDHLNHLVQVAGKHGESEATAKAVAGNNQHPLYVSGVYDLAPTCGAPAGR